MKKKEKLITFSIPKGTFTCYGDIELWEQAQFDDVNCPVVDLYDVTATRLDENGVAVDYEPTERRWNGLKYTAEDMVTSVLHALLIRDTDCKLMFIHSKLQEVLDFYRGECEMVGAVSFQRRLLKDGDKVFTLSLVTDKWVYYGHCEELEMYQYNTEKSSGNCSLHLIADGYFAEQGYYDSALGIKRGEERLLYSDEGWTTYFESVEEE